MEGAILSQPRLDAETTGKREVMERTTCRVCKSSRLHFLFSLGDQHVSDFVDAPNGMRVPLDVVLCDASQGGCGLLQLRYTVPREPLYRKYWYRSGITNTMRRALADIAHRGECLVRLAPGDIVLDIGCNDGTLLRSYTTPSLRLVGFEPATNLLAEARVGTHQVVNDFFHPRVFAEIFLQARAKIITTIAMFYDLEDPQEFIAGVAQCLDPEGVWIIQMSYLPSMLSQNAFDNICHEHLAYYSLFTLQPILQAHGLTITDVELNEINGGSFCVYVRQQGGLSANQPCQRMQELESRERQLELDHRAVYDEFARRAMATKAQLCAFIQGEIAHGKSVYVYGASTKGNTLLQFCGLDHRWITAAAERSPEKWGKKTVGTLIPIVSEAEARAARPDYFLVLPWHFLEEFIQREQAFLRSGGAFIVPLPRPLLVSLRDGTVIRQPFG